MTSRTRSAPQLFRLSAAFVMVGTEFARILTELAMEVEYMNASLGWERFERQGLGSREPEPERGWSPGMWNPGNGSSSPETSQGIGPAPDRAPSALSVHARSRECLLSPLD
ncbi:unnamed protein product [Coccothraustes coccothraustes]